jgi:hypothetical protein
VTPVTPAGTARAYLLPMTKLYTLVAACAVLAPVALAILAVATFA